MNLYWCHEKNEDYGLFAAARTPGEAKMFYSHETEIPFTDIRCNIMRHGVTGRHGTVGEEDAEWLKKYGQKYGTEEEDAYTEIY